MFHFYSTKGLGFVLPPNSTVKIEHLWGWSAKGPGEFFTVSLVTKKHNDTIVSCLEELNEQYEDICKKNGWTPREAYGYEGFVEVDERTYKILLGT